MFSRFSPEAKAVIVSAQEEARDLFHDWIGTEHLLLVVRPQRPSPTAALPGGQRSLHLVHAADEARA